MIEDLQSFNATTLFDFDSKEHEDPPFDHLVEQHTLY